VKLLYVNRECTGIGWSNSLHSTITSRRLIHYLKQTASQLNGEHASNTILLETGSW
jgi:hypothetical protein